MEKVEETVEHIDAKIDDCAMPREEFDSICEDTKIMLPDIMKRGKERMSPQLFHKFNNLVNAVEQFTEDELYEMMNTVGCICEELEDEHATRLLETEEINE